ncbi:molybdopterin molybdenumtransferase MoeA [Methanospirillum lacunae]|uniref:Molybdopterin molybdenumtransferase MoeA n=1 Tax=Methanospirillum lacunae TaxID=668570 RepID=A0A2V2N1X3_9EURY|nr:molybdopterin molybdenumtransferase MoeA [Methanospirillum lacunae]
MPRICINSQLLSFDEAKSLILSSFKSPNNRTSMPTADSCGYVIAEPVYSQRTNPPLILSGPDGIAVRSGETSNASENNPVEVEAPRVNTGMPLPEGYDAVIAVEEITAVTDTRSLIYKPVSSHQNTIAKGVDIKKGDLLFDCGHVIRAFDVGAMLSYGILDVSVKTWKVGVVATGDEIISPYTEPKPGQIVDSNSYMIASALRQFGVTPVLYPVLNDDPDAISAGIKTMISECDMVLIFGGSSAGSKDYTVDAMEQSGTLLFHGVAMGPGKPVTLAQVNNKPVFGMPGPSISTMAVLYELIFPLLSEWCVPIPSPTYIKGILTNPVPSIEGFDIFRLVRVRSENDKTLITPVPWVFGHMMGIQADAILHKKAGSDTFIQGQEVDVRMVEPNFSEPSWIHAYQ